jgi:hypothetical protein
MGVAQVCSCDVKTIKEYGFEIRAGKAFCNKCGLPDASDYLPARNGHTTKKEKDLISKFDSMYMQAWIFIILQGLGAGVVLGNIFKDTTNCGGLYCSPGFNFGAFIGGSVGTILFFGPFIFIMRGFGAVVAAIVKTND